MYLKEVQGLRAVAALLVAIYHIWFHRVSGGVDAFFVISGFFVSQSFIKPDRKNWRSVLKYYQKTFARIVPSASVVILSTCIIFNYFEIELLWNERIKSAISALFFVENYWLVENGTNYLSRDQAPSPFQQMWALSVQVQIYVFLPILILFIVYFCKRVGRPERIAAALTMLLTIAFFYALLATHRDQPQAYFSTLARLWEFLAGGCLALWISCIRLSKPAAKVLGYSGLLILLSFASLIPVQNLFPGFSALIPVISTAAIIVAAANGSQIGILINPVSQWLGNISFTFYLWHWPLYVLAWDLTGSPQVGLQLGIGILLSSFILAVATFQLAEQPFRKLPQINGRFLPAIMLCIAAMIPASAGAALWATNYLVTRNIALQDMEAVRQGEKVNRIVPNDVLIKSDVAVSYKDGCYQRIFDSSEVIECSYGNPMGSQTIVLVGGSHALQWLPALQKISEDHSNLHIINMSKSGCTLTLSVEDISIDSNVDTCLEWSQKAISRILSIKPDAVMTMGSRVDYDKAEIIPEGYVKAWKALDSLPIMAIRDNPQADFDIAACVDRLGAQHPSCSLKRYDVLGENLFFNNDTYKNVSIIDLSDLICDKEICYPVRDNIAIYRDSNHLTATFVVSLADELEILMKQKGFLE